MSVFWFAVGYALGVVSILLFIYAIVFWKHKSRWFR